MKRNKDNRTNSEDSLDSFSLMEDAIDLSIQQEYFNLSETIDFDNIDYKEVFKESSKLFSENTPVETKKRILIPIDVAIGDVIEEGISQCNKMEEFLFFHYYVTNVKKPTNEEILQYLEEIRQRRQICLPKALKTV